MLNKKMPSICYLLILSLLFSSISSQNVISISGVVPDDSNYNRAKFHVGSSSESYFFKYSFSNPPPSRIGAFRFDFSTFDTASKKNEVKCTFVDPTASDKEIIDALNTITKETSACIGSFTELGIYDGIFKYDKTKTLFVVSMKTTGELESDVTIYLRTTEKTLDVSEQKVTDYAKYSLIPFTIHISQFRPHCSKILFFSRTRDMQMYYVEGDKTYPERLFFGNIMSVYTNPHMVRMKYKNADTMLLLTRPFDKEEPMGEQFQFQVKFFSSNSLLDYYMGTNPLGREKNSPLAINMTTCAEPYYVILNYNQKEGRVNLYIDQIYGKIKSLSVATSFKSITWEDMIQKDLVSINIREKKYELPKDSPTHMDVYKIECSQPLLLNFYYVDEYERITELNYGQVVINTLYADRVLTLPFNEKVTSPQLTIEVFNPFNDPFVMVNDGISEFIVSKNSLVKLSSMNTEKSLVIKEKGGDDNTRVIIKVGYSTIGSSDWEKISENIVYNKAENMYVFKFPSATKRYNYTDVLLETSGTNAQDNVKYCYGTNIGSAILPSRENCYRVSKDDKYTIKLMNPFVMYKDYELDDTLIYFVTLKPTKLDDKFTINEKLEEYDAKKRNFETYPNIVELTTSTTESTILGYPKDNDESVFYQITSCAGNELKYSIFNAYDSSKIVEETTIAPGTKNYFAKFDNVFGETKLQLTGTKDDKIFVKHNGVTKAYAPTIKSEFKLTFDSTTNSIKFTRPTEKSERFNYTVYIAKEGELSQKHLTICSFVYKKELDNIYSRTFSTYTDGYMLPINFKRIGLDKGQKFEAIAYIEQDMFAQMAFVTDLLTDTVGEIKQETITEIKDVHQKDSNYVYYHQEAKTELSNLYFSFKNSEVSNESVGALRIELDEKAEGGFNTIQCAWVDDGADAMTMVEAIEEVSDTYNSYCTGGIYKLNNRLFNYIFSYSYTQDSKPRRLVIKVPAIDPNTGFSIYVRKGQNTMIKQTDFVAQEEYGRQEEYLLSFMPYTLDLEAIRGEGTDYVSKVLIYSKHLEMQMYYIDPKGKTNAPIRLFTGNVMLVYTKPQLARQKYFGTKLILLSENIRGQEHSSLGNSFRFHTKMFRSTDQIEYFVSNEASGRTTNFPLSLEVNTCTNSNNKYYYILNYNLEQEPMNLYFELIFGSFKSARIATEINEEKWDTLVSKMTEIKDYFTTIPSRKQHIDIVEIQCNTPLLANIYYNNDQQTYSWVTLGDVVVKNLKPRETLIFYLDTVTTSNMYFSVEVFASEGDPNIKLSFPDNATISITENSLQSGILFRETESITVDNNGNSNTRFIFKVGFGVENIWHEEKRPDIKGKVFSKDNRYVFRFDTGTRGMNVTNVEITVKPVRKESQPPPENIKFCYSSSLGMPIKSSKENCFRTGANIPYTLKFINPNISPKTYKAYSNNYYITLTPQNGNDYISVEITENKYETKDRNLEGYGQIITIDPGLKNKSTILSIPEEYTNKEVVVQLQICSGSSNIINYINYNAYTSELISTGNIEKKNKFFYYQINNNLMETRLELQGAENDKIFVKHAGISSYTIKIENYISTFIESSNSVRIVKPIFQEEFMFTVIVGKPGSLSNITLCTFMEKKHEDLGDYVKSFSSVSSDEITHFIDFYNFEYKEGQEFDLLVYAVQTKNTKFEFLYNVISGKVGKISNLFIAMRGAVHNNIVSETFYKNQSNYFYYDFASNPVGDVATLKITNEGETSVTVTKVICTFVKKDLTDADMLKIINLVPQNGTNLCKGEEKKNENGYNALINAKEVKRNNNPRLLIMVQYGVGEKEESNKDYINDDVQLKINVRISGFDVSENEKKYNEDETEALVPYVFDLTKIRNSAKEYISKVLIYSSKRELEMFHLQTGTPQQLFTGNILLVYTNPDVIREKYQGATTMILLTESLFKDPEPIIGESFRFKPYFFKSDNTMQYYVSSNPNGRPINTPTTMDMPDCTKPYYYILNYHFKETKDVTLHIDKVYGQISSKKIAVDLNYEDWHDLIENMYEFFDNELLIKQKSQYHIDVIEATCLTPTLLHIYYNYDNEPAIEGIKPGETSIINIDPSTTKELKIQGNIKPGYTLIFSFNILCEEREPNIRVNLPLGDPIFATKNGIYIRKTKEDFQKIVIKNEDIGGSSLTRIIFKFGYEIEDKFQPIQNQIYYLNGTDNLFGYKFKTEDDWLNITSVDFVVSTYEENVKFCYSASFGAYMEPAMQDCYRVGRANSYKLNIINPYLMYKDYVLDGNEVMKYYMGFKTVDQSQNITITPGLHYYQDKIRNLENIPNTVSVTKNNRTLLTPPNNISVFIQLQVCTPDKKVDIEFFNAYNNTPLKYKDNIHSDQKIFFTSFENIRLDTGLNLTTDNSAKVFVRHTGLEEEYSPYYEELAISFDRENRSIKFKQPIAEEEFNYTVFIDNYGTLKNKGLTLCSVAENIKLAHYTKTINSSEENVKIDIDFDSPLLVEYKEFDAIVLAEQVNNGKLMFLSNLIQTKVPGRGSGNNNNTTLIIVIVVLGVVLVAGGIVIFFCLKKYKERPNSKKLDAKQTSLAMVDNENEKMIISTATEKNE